MVITEEILREYNEAEDKKSVVVQLATEHDVGIWEVATALKAAGAKINLAWFNKYNPNFRSNLPQKKDGRTPSEKVQYLQLIIDRQAAEITNLNEMLKGQSDDLQAAAKAAEDLRAELADAQRKREDLRRQVSEAELYVNKVDNENAELHKQLEQEIDLGMNDYINEFCEALHGVEAYLCGRIIESLYCWRYGDGLDPLRILPGLISELIDMQIDKKEANL